MRKIANAWDEKVLIANRNPFYRLQRQDEHELEFTLCGKRYVLPADEVVVLDTDNISCETLARAYFDSLHAQLPEAFASENIRSVSVYIEESPGQGAAYQHAKS
jgi:6-pyruvoyltetrahydropterin/6-carboxytetrahydropterin synthase